jgi:hypothetical protein
MEIPMTLESIGGEIVALFVFVIQTDGFAERSQQEIVQLFQHHQHHQLVLLSEQPFNLESLFVSMIVKSVFVF